MSTTTKIVIVGAGLAGLTMATLLSRSRHSTKLDVSVIDAAARPQFLVDADVSLRVSAIANGTAEVLQSVGAWNAVTAKRVSSFTKMRVWDEHDSPHSDSVLKFDAAEFATPQLGFIVENVLLQHALLEVLDATNVRLQFDTRIDALPQADLVIAADGARSVVRDLANIETKVWPYEQSALVTHLQAGQAHNATAYQRFLRDGPLGMLPLSDGRISVVWSTLPETAKRCLDLDDQALGGLLTTASDGVLGDLKVAGPRGAFPLQAQHAAQYVRPGLALIGDAAHAIHPLAGQGANLGVQDAVALSEVIDRALGTGRHPGDRPVLRQYERSRKGANLTMLHLMTGLNRVFATDSAMVGELRSIGMRMFDRSGPIKERAVKVALGVK